MGRKALVLMLAAAVGILAGGLHPIEADSSLRKRVADNPDPGQPDYILAGQNASLQYWKNADGSVSQALYRSADETVSVRTFYDEATALPRKVSDELTGNWLLIQENGADSVDFWFYDRIGSYQDGFAVFEDSGQYYFGGIAGLPVHAGKEITGDLVSTTASWTGSFTLDADTGDLKTHQPVAAEIADLIDDLAPDDTLLGGLSVGGMILLGLGLPDGSSGDALAPVDMAAFDALVDGKDVVFTHADSGYALSVEFLSAGRFVWTDENGSYPGNFSYLDTGPDTGTITLTLDPNNDHDEYEYVFEVTFTSGTAGTHGITYNVKDQEPVDANGTFKIEDTVAITGAAAFVTSLFVPDVAAGTREKCTRLGDATSRDVCRLAADFLAQDVEGRPTGLVRDAVDWAKDKPRSLGERVDRGKEALENAAGELLPDDAIQERQDAEPLSSETPPPIGSHVSGEASGPDGTVAQIEGDITPNGDFTVTGDDDDNLSVVINGTLGDDDTADSGELTPTLTGTGTLSHGVMGNIVVSTDTRGDSAAFEWGGDSGRVRSVRSALPLHGNAPVVVRKIVYVKGPNDGSSLTLDLSEYFADPNGDSMRFTAVAGFQEHLDVRVLGSILSIRPTTPEDTFSTVIRVTATDPGGLTAEMPFLVRITAPKAVLWTTSFYSSAPYKSYEYCVDGQSETCVQHIGRTCREYVILDSEAYERQRLRSGGQIPRRGNHFPLMYLPSIDRRFGELECSGGRCAWSDGLNCPDSYVNDGGCREVFDWGTYTGFSWQHVEVRLEFQRQYSESCRSHGYRWVTERPQSKDIISSLKGLIRKWVEKSYDVPSPSRCTDCPRTIRTDRTVFGVRG